MKKFVALLTTVLTIGLLTSAGHATCVASGEISRVSVNPGGTFSSFLVITSTPAQPSYAYFTTDVKIISAAIAAQASHMTVTTTGGAASCPPPSSGYIYGGVVNTFTTAP